MALRKLLVLVAVEYEDTHRTLPERLIRFGAGPAPAIYTAVAANAIREDVKAAVDGLPYVERVEAVYLPEFLP